MLSILASGTLITDPVSRTSTTGKTYATASVRVPAEDADAMLVSVIAFAADAVAAILALAKRDFCSAICFALSHQSGRCQRSKIICVIVFPK